MEFRLKHFTYVTLSICIVLSCLIYTHMLTEHSTFEPNFDTTLQNYMAETSAPNLIPVHIDLNVAEMNLIVDHYLAESRKVYDSVAASASNPSFEHTLYPFYSGESASLSTLLEGVTLMSYVADEKERRDAAFAARQRLSAFGIEMFMRQDVYAALKALKDMKLTLDTEANRLLGKMVRSRQRAGLDKPEKERNEIQALMTRISDLSNEFKQAIQDAEPIVRLPASALAGVPETTLASFPQEDGLYVLNCKEYPVTTPIAQHCSVRATRELVSATANSIALPDNLHRLAEIVNLRAEVAERLGFSSHADQTLQDMLVSGPDEVVTFHADMRAKLAKTALETVKEYNQLALTLGESVQKPDGDLIDEADTAFLARIFKEKNFNFDPESIRPYLPTEVVIPRVMEMVAGLNGFTAKPVETVVRTFNTGESRSIDALNKNRNLIDADGRIITWHADVRVYRIAYASNDALIGYAFLDLYPRPGTYSHACCSDMVTPFRHTAPSGHAVEQPAVALVLANFSPATPAGPSLLRHGELETALHEIGHMFHVLSSRTRYDGAAAFSIESDAVELPSQAMEGFGWERDALKVLTSHHETGEPLPDELIDRLLAARTAGQALSATRQIQLGVFDMNLHMRRADAKIKAADISNLLHSLAIDVGLTRPLPGACMAGRFAHLVGGYNARYFTYLYSRVIAEDAFDAITAGSEGKGAKNVAEYVETIKKNGMRWQTEILRVGASRDARDSIRAFLGRDAQPDALLRSWGIEVDSKH